MLGAHKLWFVTQHPSGSLEVQHLLIGMCRFFALSQGYITPAELYTFFQTIHEMWVAIGEYADLSVYDVVDEILDMVNPKVSSVSSLNRTGERNSHQVKLQRRAACLHNMLSAHKL